MAPRPPRGTHHTTPRAAFTRRGMRPRPDRRLGAVSGSAHRRDRRRADHSFCPAAGGLRGSEPALFGRRGRGCHRFGWCLVFTGDAPRGRKGHASLRHRGGRGAAAGTAVFCGEEDDMSDTTPALDEAFERMAAASFELPNGFVNHGAMACEALAILDCAGDIDSWARRFAQAGGARIAPVASAGFEWRQALGAYDRLPEWIGYFARAIDDEGWEGVVETWVPRLMPALRTALFHGAIRTAHAVRAIEAVDTSPRRGELARALGYWAARYQAGQPAGPQGPTDDPRAAVIRAAADGARRYLAQPNIVHLHGITGAMAVEILIGHIPATEATAALAQVHAEHAALYVGVEPVAEPHPASPPGGELTAAAVHSLDPHQVKLVEACQRGLAATDDPAFAAAAETVTGLP